MLSDEKLKSLREKAIEIRISIIEMVHHARSGHTSGSLGPVEILVALYYHVMKHDPKDPEWPVRDRFVLSKGHCAPALYAVLADCGYFPREDLQGLRQIGQHLQGHPNHRKTPGVEATTGSLGQGLSIALGMALAARMRDGEHFCYVMCGDGEIQEGQIWEAAMLGSKYGLDNVIAFVDRNYYQHCDHTEKTMPLDPTAPRWQAFGWDTAEVDGHNFAQIIQAVEKAKTVKGRPSMIIARTTKGKGVSFLENLPGCHGKPLTDEQRRLALEEISRGI
ncbi:MAG: transketolase [Phycisphaerae bacterium]|nr:transketolase [Phycisphaerae bacterium]